MLKLGVLVSGGGTNLQAIIDKLAAGKITNCELAVVVSSKEGAYALERAKNAGVATEVVCKKSYASVEAYDKALIEALDKHDVDFVVLAGFMCILGADFIKKYENKIINVHPALIPSFCGKGFYGLTPHIEALKYGVKITGATVHFVTEGADEGPIILQGAVKVKNDDTPEVLQRRVMEEVEWELLPEAIDLFCNGRLKLEGRVVKIMEAK